MGWSNLTLDQVRTALRIPNSSQGTLLAQLLPEAEAAVESYCKRKFAYTTNVVEYPKGGGEAFTLRQRPVAADPTLLSVYLDPSGFFGHGTNAFAADTLLAEGTDYALDRDQPDGSSRSGVFYRLGGGAVG